MLRISACKALREESGWEKEMKDFDKADTGAGKQTLVLCMHLPTHPSFQPQDLGVTLLIEAWLHI